MRILITGGAGYIGSHATRLFLNEGHDVVVYDNLSRGHRQSVPSESLVVGELSNTQLLEAVCHARKIEAIIHFAGLTYVGESMDNPEIYYQNNFVGTLSLLAAARRCEIRRIVFSSTAAVYGTPRRVPIVETDELKPINPYGRTKLMIEQLLADNARAYGLGYTALRYFNACGADSAGDIGEDHSPETHLIPIVLQAALGQRSHVDIFGADYPTADGTCIRDYIHVNDLAAAHLLAVQQIEPGCGTAMNLGLGQGYSVREVIRVCREVTGRDIRHQESSVRPGDPAELVASAQTATERLNWKPRFTDLPAIVASAWNWHCRHPQGYEKRR